MVVVDGGSAVTRETYPNAPIALAACEVRLPPSGLPLSDAQVARLKELLQDDLPVSRSQDRHQVAVPIKDGVAEPAQQMTERVQQFSDRRQSCVALIGPKSFVVKTADYQGWEKLRPLLARTMRAVRDVLEPDGFDRVGLRYIDEIRLPEGRNGLADWQDYLTPTLLAPAELASASNDLNPTGWHSIAQFTTARQHRVVVRYGPGDGHVVNPQEPPKRPYLPPSGPFFGFDIDSFWETDGEVPEFDPDELMELCDELHRPVRALFEAAITDKLRDEVLREERV